MGKRLTQEEFEANLKERHPNLKVLGKYQGSKVKILTRCKTCGYEWECCPNNLYSLVKGSGCLKCSRVKLGNDRRNSIDKVIERFNKVHNGKYNYSKTEYKSCDEKICVTCLKHGDFWITPSNHYAGHGCPQCGNEGIAEQLNSNTEEFIKKAISVHGTKYDYSKVNYIDAKTPIEIICKEHGSFMQTPNSHLNGNGCTKCSNHYLRTTEEWIQKANEIHNNKYSYSKTIFTKSENKVIITCPKHGDFEQTASDHLQGSGCPKYRASKEELLIDKLLKNRNIEFISLYRVNSYRVDFYLPKLNTFIEYNGIQHYVPQEHFGGELRFQKLLERDNFIKDYCNENSIRLIEIPYNLSIKEVESIINNL